MLKSLDLDLEINKTKRQKTKITLRYAHSPFRETQLVLRTRPLLKQLTSCLLIMTSINDAVNDVSNFVVKSPRDKCEVSN